MDQQTRQEYIRAAVSFLQNPKLIDSTLQEKLTFLRNKGLTEVELDEALNYALISRHQSQSGKWNFILILGLCVGGYKLYQAYLKSTQAEAGTRPSSVTSCSPTDSSKREHYEKARAESKAQNRAKELNDFYAVYRDRDTKTLKDILERLTELKKLIELQRSNFASDVQSLKTLLLGHEKFAAPPVIPAWQLPTTDKSQESEKQKSIEDKKDVKTSAKKTKENGNKQMPVQKKNADSSPKGDEQSVQNNGESSPVNGESAAK